MTTKPEHLPEGPVTYCFSFETEIDHKRGDLHIQAQSYKDLKRALALVASVAPARPYAGVETVECPDPKATQIEWTSDGYPRCPTHKNQMKQGKWGYYCPHKDKATGEFCKHKVNKAA